MADFICRVLEILVILFLIMAVWNLVDSNGCEQAIRQGMRVIHEMRG